MVKEGGIGKLPAIHCGGHPGYHVLCRNCHIIMTQYKNDCSPQENLMKPNESKCNWNKRRGNDGRRMKWMANRITPGGLGKRVCLVLHSQCCQFTFCLFGNVALSLNIIPFFSDERLDLEVWKCGSLPTSTGTSVRSLASSTWKSTQFGESSSIYMTINRGQGVVLSCPVETPHCPLWRHFSLCWILKGR